jgi:hypothetical protein
MALNTETARALLACHLAALVAAALQIEERARFDRRQQHE